MKSQNKDNPVPSLDKIKEFLYENPHMFQSSPYNYKELCFKGIKEILENGVETDNGQPKEIEELKQAFNSAIKSVDVNKIKKVNEHYYSTDNWLEEQCTPTYPTITIHRSGIGNTISLNGKDVTDDSIDW